MTKAAAEETINKIIANDKRFKDLDIKITLKENKEKTNILQQNKRLSIIKYCN